MANPHYTRTFDVTPGNLINSQNLENQFILVEQGFDAVNVQLLLKGNIAGQAWTGAHSFAGSITAPTQTQGNNSTNVATTAYTDAAVAAEAALRVSNDNAEIAARTAADALKANLSGATFTGPVSVPEPTVGAHAATKTYADGLAWTAGQLPLQTGNAGKFVTTNGTTASWASLPPATGATIYLALNAGAL